DAAGANDGEHPLIEGSSPREIEAAIVQSLAGYAADIRFYPRGKSRARARAGDDERDVAHFFRFLNLRGNRRAEREAWLRKVAADLVEKHWSAVSALAKELQEHRTLDGCEATWIVAIAEGESAKKDRQLRARWKTLVARDEQVSQDVIVRITNRRRRMKKPPTKRK